MISIVCTLDRSVKVNVVNRFTDHLQTDLNWSEEYYKNQSGSFLVKLLVGHCLQIVELIKSRGATSRGEAAAVLGANRDTIKVHSKNLVNDGHLEKVGVGRGIRYKIRS